jgi:hypothetical protein
MAQTLTLDKIHDTILEATHRSNDIYLTMSGGGSVYDNGVESLISSTIASRLWLKANNKRAIPPRSSEKFRFTTTLETPFHHVAYDSGSERKGQKGKRFTQSERIDVVYWAGQHPQGVVEVKRYFEFSRMESDLERVTFLLRRYGRDHGGSVRWGAIAGMRPIWDNNEKEPKLVLSDGVDKITSKYKNFIVQGRLKRSLLNKPQTYDRGVFHGYDAFVVMLTNTNR